MIVVFLLVIITLWCLLFYCGVFCVVLFLLRWVFLQCVHCLTINHGPCTHKTTPSRLLPQPRASCWRAPPGPARPTSPAPWLGSMASPFSLPTEPSLWRCSVAPLLRASATCLSGPGSEPLPSSSSVQGCVYWVPGSMRLGGRWVSSCVQVLSVIHMLASMALITVCYYFKNHTFIYH